MRARTAPPRCDDEYFDEAENRWVQGEDCGSHTCASSSSFDVNAAHRRGEDN